MFLHFAYHSKKLCSFQRRERKESKDQYFRAMNCICQDFMHTEACCFS